MAGGCYVIPGGSIRISQLEVLRSLAAVSADDF